jgi:uncharacterized membrane-anchored protein
MRKWGVLAAAVVILAVINVSILQKERHLADGRVVYLELAPVDPRSLMQGDYMTLNFAIQDQIRQAQRSRQAAAEKDRSYDGRTTAGQSARCRPETPGFSGSRANNVGHQRAISLIVAHSRAALWGR